MSDKLKAYEVRDSGEGYCVIQYATNSATARREGASKLDTDWDSIESCVRKPEFDAYAPGPVPPMVMIEHGWWFECFHCGRRVSNDMSEEIEDDGLDPDDFVPRASDIRAVFCSAACEAESAANARLNEWAKDALAELFEVKFPGATISHLHVYGTKLEKTKRGCGINSSVRFRFPGAKYESRWDFGEKEVWVPPIDLEAFRVFFGVEP